MICKTANLRTLCLPALLFVLHILHHRLLFGPTRSFSPFPCLSLAPPFSLSLSRSCTLYFDSTRLPPSRVSQPSQTRTPIQIVTLSLSRRPPPSSHSPAFPHPCGTSRKLYVPTLATLNAGLARDNPRPSPPPSTTADPPRPPVVLPISAACPFSLRADGPPGFTTS